MSAQEARKPRCDWCCGLHPSRGRGGAAAAAAPAAASLALGGIAAPSAGCGAALCPRSTCAAAHGKCSLASARRGPVSAVQFACPPPRHGVCTTKPLARPCRGVRGEPAGGRPPPGAGGGRGLPSPASCSGSPPPRSARVETSGWGRCSDSSPFGQLGCFGASPRFLLFRSRAGPSGFRGASSRVNPPGVSGVPCQLS